MLSHVSTLFAIATLLLSTTTGFASTTTFSRVFIDNVWQDPLGQARLFPPVGLSSDYAIVAQSQAGIALCSYDDEMLNCEYRDIRNQPTNGLLVPAGQVYSVKAVGVPDGWKVDRGVGRFNESEVQMSCEDGSSNRACTHLVRNVRRR